MNRCDVFSGSAVPLEQMLSARETRVRRQKAFLSETACTSLISFTLNIPGPIKQSPILRRAFDEGIQQLYLTFESHSLKESLQAADTGSELFLALNVPPGEAKAQTMQIENSHPLGRLFDMDVLDQKGNLVSRTIMSFPQRRCLVCGKDAKLCARSRAHSVEELQSRIAMLIDAYFRDKEADRFASCACRALLYEVSVTPKPGLVDRCNSGSHTDMDFFTFLDSVSALTPWLREMFRTGWDHADSDMDPLFASLRSVGRQAEQAMFGATGGVNTHKGIIFSLAVLGGAYGRLYARSADMPPLDQVLSVCRSLGRCALRELPASAAVTHGERCFHAYGASGVRGEAAHGFSSVVQVGVPALCRALDDGLSLNDAAAYALLALIGSVEDTNMLHRGGRECAQACRNEAQALYDANASLDDIARLDRQYIAKNLSPGGCADLLTLSLLLHFLSAKQGAS